MEYKYKKALVYFRENRQFLPLLLIVIFLIIGRINSIYQNYLILQLHGIDRLFNNLFLFIIFGLPLVIFFYLLMKSKKHFLIKLYQLIITTPIILIVCLVVGHQTMISFRTDFVVSLDAKTIIEYGIVQDKDSYNSHGERYTLYLNTPSEECIRIPSNKSEFKHLMLGDSVKIKYKRNDHGSIYVERGDMRAN